MAISPDSSSAADGLRPEYDFRSIPDVRRGKHAAAYQAKLRVVRLADDVAEAFANEEAVNAALREYLRGRGQMTQQQT